MQSPPLACPVSQLPLAPAPPRLVARLQGLARQKALRNEDARLIPDDFTAAWISADRQRAWLVRGGFGDFRPGEAVLLAPEDLAE